MIYRNVCVLGFAFLASVAFAVAEEHSDSPSAPEAQASTPTVTIPENLFEAELFGHAKGAFTGAVNDRVGRFEQAHRGTIFLDEIGEMPLTMQPKLLRVLQDGEIMAVGSTRPERVDVRVLSASNRDLKAAADSGTFRADLYYRLAAFPIALPPLRARNGDIPLLAARFLSASSERQRKLIRDIDPKALALLESYPWPGNVRELQNEIERAVALTPPGEIIKPERLSEKIRSGSNPALAIGPALSRGPSSENGDLRFARADFEARHITEVLARNQGNVSRSAKVLGISRISLQRKMKEYNLEIEARARCNVQPGE